ncbi:hypothetical protein GGI21_001217 [Coemansia aciculifera]|nr:hypothetical protein GGI21_001217 [Coemansia aciculifera]
MASACTFVPNPAKLTGRALKVMQPNYTLAIRLTDPSLQQELAKFSDFVHRERPKYRKHLVKPDRLYIPVASMHLGTQASLDAASDVLQRSRDLVERHLTTTKPVLQFKGLTSHDTGAVVSTSDCNVPSELLFLVRELRLRFWSLGYVAKASTMPPHIPYFVDNVAPSGSEFTVTGGKISSWTPRITLMRVQGTDLSRKKKEATASFKSATKKGGGVVVEDGVARKLTINDFFGIPSSVFQPFEGK